MCNLKCSVATLIVGVILVIGSCVLAFVVVPIIVENIILGETVLIDDSIQMERFETVPFSMDFKVRIFTISNPEQVLNGGVPTMVETGPYVYKLYPTRNISRVVGDLVTYRRIERFEFDAEASFPHTEDDMVTIINIPYHAITQIAEASFASLMPALNQGLSDVFGEHNSPVMTVRVGDLLFAGITICKDPGFFGNIVCAVIRSIGARAQNLVPQEDGSLVFSLLDYKADNPSVEYEAYRGLDDHTRLGDIRLFDGRNHFLFWEDGNSNNVCNMVRGTDTGIFAPFVRRDRSLFGVNTDICRSVELRYQHDDVVNGIPVYHFSVNEWFLDNNEQCYCLNETQGINREDGCLLEGAMELSSCVGAPLVLTYPHFLYADSRYRNSILGMNPVVEDHRIFANLEPNTGTPISGAKRAQFNIFQRAVSGITSSQRLRTALVPIAWIDESFELPEELADEIRNRLLASLDLLDVLLPVAIALCAAVLLVGVGTTVRAKRAVRATLQNPDNTTTDNKK